MTGDYRSRQSLVFILSKIKKTGGEGNRDHKTREGRSADMSDSWVVQNLNNALNTWNEKLAEVWELLLMSPQSFKGGGIWKVILQINGAVQAIGLALLVLFFLVGVVKTTANLT